MAPGFRHLIVVSDSQEGLLRPAYHVITSETNLHNVYGNVSLRPAVSLARDLLVCVHRGLCPTGGYTITVEDLRFSGCDLVVRVCTRDPSPDEFVTLTATCPADAVAVSRRRLRRHGVFRAVFEVGGIDVAVVPFVV